MKALSMRISGRTLFISGAKSAKVEVFDMQGRPVFNGKCETGVLELKGISEGVYMVRIREQSTSLVRKIAIK